VLWFLPFNWMDQQLPDAARTPVGLLTGLLSTTRCTSYLLLLSIPDRRILVS